jgi:hypothetical protein
VSDLYFNRSIMIFSAAVSLPRCGGVQRLIGTVTTLLPRC